MKQVFMSSVVLAAGETDKAKWLDSLKSGTVLFIPKKYIKTKCKQTRKKSTHTKKNCNKICLGNGYFLQVLRYD